MIFLRNLIFQDNLFPLTLRLLDFYYKKIYEGEYARYEVERIKQPLQELVQEYKGKQLSHCTSSTVDASSSDQSCMTRVDMGFMREFAQYIENTSHKGNQS
ncbi:hypothetical protein Dimus_018888 [Dionaea muscipula]